MRQSGGEPLTCAAEADAAGLASALLDGCVLRLTSSDGGDEGLDCRTQPGVTFDCAGTHIANASAMRMFDAAGGRSDPDAC